MNREAMARRPGRRLRAFGLLVISALAATAVLGAADLAWAQYTTLSGNVSTSQGPNQQQAISDNPNASLSGVESQDAFGNEAKAGGTLAALEGRFSLASHACSGGGPGMGGIANASAQCTVTQDYQVVSATLPVGTPVMIRINWALSGQGTAAGTLTHYTSGAVGGVNGHVSISVGGVIILNVTGERRREYTTSSGYYQYVFGTLNAEEDHGEHVVSALVGQAIRIYMAGTATGNSSATLSSVTDGDAQMAMLWGISSEDPNASVVSLTYPGTTPPPAANATPANAEAYRPGRPPGLQECFAFSEQPAAASACAATSAGFAVSVAGTGPFSYEWYRNGVRVDPGTNPSAATATLELPGVTANEAGSYTVKVTNPCGVRTSQGALLTVLAPPAISVHPAATFISPPATAAVSVVASGSGVNYLWQIQTAPGVWADLGSQALALPCGGTAGTDLDNASTVQISLSPCPGVTEYQVRAVVSNSCGTSTSNAATITVVSPSGVPGDATNSPTLFARPAPNPTNGLTTLAYTLAGPTPVRLEIFDLAGRLVKVLVAEEQAAGRYEPQWAGTDESGGPVPPGIYFARLRTTTRGKVATAMNKINLVR